MFYSSFTPSSLLYPPSSRSFLYPPPPPPSLRLGLFVWALLLLHLDPPPCLGPPSSSTSSFSRPSSSSGFSIYSCSSLFLCFVPLPLLLVSSRRRLGLPLSLPLVPPRPGPPPAPPLVPLPCRRFLSLVF